MCQKKTNYYGACHFPPKIWGPNKHFFWAKLINFAAAISPQIINQYSNINFDKYFVGVISGSHKKLFQVVIVVKVQRFSLNRK